ncbi:hypothetical protein [Rahnella sp. WP5]|uniref:hypothetical protein n=1 Tax=Rahnella sp. WP5 TaxID=1500266 RepID=UPI00056102D7|nr:hypothetical protein [Rahnella sp. WP5]
MNLSSNIRSLTKMAVFSAIFFGVLTGCSFAAMSDNSNSKLNFDNVIPLEKNNSSFFKKNEGFCLNPAQNTLKICKDYYENFNYHYLAENKNSNNALGHYSLNNKTLNTGEPNRPSEIYNLVNIPEGGPEWVSIIISIFALILSCGIPYWQHKKERTESINEGFWLREVIMPKISDLAFDVCNVFKSSLDLDENDFNLSFESSLLPKLGELRDSLYLFECYPDLEEKIDELQTICDDFENNVDNNQNALRERRQKDISDFHIKFIAKLIFIHKSIG